MNKETKEKTKKIIKKNARKEVYDKLVQVLSEYKNGTDSKKFDRRLQKATKLFVPFIVKAKADAKEFRIKESTIKE